MTNPLPREIYNPVQRDRVTFLKTADETDGEFTLIDLEVAPGGGNPLHFHATFTERFTVEAGELGARIGKRRLTLRAGEGELVPLRVVHRWFNPSAETVRARVELRPGHSGFEESLRISYGLARDGRINAKGIPKSFLHLAVLAELSDTRVTGLLRWMNPLFGQFARIARSRGVEAELKRRYCT